MKIKRGVSRALANITPMGQAFLLVILVNSAMWLVILSSNPADGYLHIEFSDIPAEYETRWEKKDLTGNAVGSIAPDCHWLEPTKESIFSRGTMRPEMVSDKLFYRIECPIEGNADTEQSSPESSTSSLDYFENASEWSTSGYGFSYRTSSEIQLDLLASIVFMSIPLGVTIFILRQLSPAREIKRSFRTLLKQPWLLFIVPLTVISASVVTSLIWPADLALSDQYILGEVNVAVVSSLVFILPLFEESVFRQWLYQRTIRRLSPILAGLGNAWFFMLTHAFNPQLSSGINYLLVMFAMGCALFWIRHRFRSFGLAALAHITNNMFFVLIAFGTS